MADLLYESLKLIFLKDKGGPHRRAQLVFPHVGPWLPTQGAGSLPTTSAKAEQRWLSVKVNNQAVVQRPVGGGRLLRFSPARMRLLRSVPMWWLGQGRREPGL
jgi:hypothetical protein